MNLLTYDPITMDPPGTYHMFHIEHFETPRCVDPFKWINTNCPRKTVPETGKTNWIRFNLMFSLSQSPASILRERKFS